MYFQARTLCVQFLAKTNARGTYRAIETPQDLRRLVFDSRGSRDISLWRRVTQETINMQEKLSFSDVRFITSELSKHGKSLSSEVLTAFEDNIQASAALLTPLDLSALLWIYCNDVESINAVFVTEMLKAARSASPEPGVWLPWKRFMTSMSKTGIKDLDLLKTSCDVLSNNAQSLNARDACDILNCLLHFNSNHNRLISALAANPLQGDPKTLAQLQALLSKFK
jgi:hypothetical protein